MMYPEDVKLSREEILRDYALQRAIDFYSGVTAKPEEVIKTAVIFEGYLVDGRQTPDPVKLKTVP